MRGCSAQDRAPGRSAAWLVESTIQAVERPVLRPQVPHERGVIEPGAGDAPDQILALVDGAGTVHVLAHPGQDMVELAGPDVLRSRGIVLAVGIPEQGR